MVQSKGSIIDTFMFMKANLFETRIFLEVPNIGIGSCYGQVCNSFVILLLQNKNSPFILFIYFEYIQNLC